MKRTKKIKKPITERAKSVPMRAVFVDVFLSHCCSVFKVSAMLESDPFTIVVCRNNNMMTLYKQ